MWKYIRLVAKCGWRILWDFTFYIWPYARHPERTPLEKRYKKVRSLIIYVLDRYRIDWHVKGLENLRALEKSNTKYLMVINHLSDLDPLAIVYWCEKPISFVAKKEIKHFPFISSAVEALDGVFLDRENLRQNVGAFQKVEQYISSGYCSVMIFPEGTRNRHPEGETAPFHSGSFKPAYRTGCPILPLVMWGTERPFHASIDYKRYPVAFTFFKPIVKEEFEANTPEEATKIRTMIVHEVYKLRYDDETFFLAGKENVPLPKLSKKK
jgi:1-acyl-sn-glycerol-3-phosphate acyltransferase